GAGGRRFWRLKASYSPEAVDADLGRLRALYFSEGYWGARVRLDDVETDGTGTRVRILAEAGPRERTRESVADLCSCLFAQRRESELEGVLDFEVRIRDGQAISLPHGQYRVGRIE